MSTRRTSNSGLVGRNLGAGRVSGTSSGVPWYREPSWLALPDVTGQQRLVGVHAVYPESNFLAMNCAGSLGYTVDFGDGTTTSVATGVQVNKEYDYTSASLAGTDAPCTLTDVGDVVTRTAHGYSNGMEAKFFNIVSTTGLVNNFTYFVISATANTFQVALTAGGAAVALTIDGTATLLPFKQAIVSVTPQSTGTLTLININVKHAAIGGVTLPAYSSGFLDVAIAGANLTTLTIGGPTPIVMADLEQVQLIGANGITSMASLFASCTALQSVPLLNTAAVTNMTSMFSSCRMLQTVPLLNTAAVTSMNSMFTNCTALQSVPLFNTAAVTSMSSMFNSCSTLQSVPLFNTVAVTNMSIMFNGCNVLQSVPLFNTAIVTNMASMFQSCLALQSVPLFNTVAVTDMSNMFNNCPALQSVPLFNTAAVTNMSGMFSGCRVLQTVPLLNTAAVTSMNSMFSICLALQSVPLFNTAIVTNMTSMFASCSALQSVPLFNTVAVTNMSNIFIGCNALLSVPLFNTAAVTNMTSMFQNSRVLQSVPLFNTAAMTNMSGMFSGCLVLQSVPLFNTVAVTDMNTMLSGCPALQSVPLFNTVAVTDMSNMFNSCPALQSVPLFNTAAVTNMTSIFASCNQLATGRLAGTRFAISYAGCKLSKSALENIFNGLGTASGAQTITLGVNYGAPAVVSLAGTTTAGSATVTMASTAGIVVGMQVTGVNSPLITAVAVTLQDAGDTVTRVAHGLANGDEVSFATIVTTTGIATFTTYFVVGAVADTFQIALTSGGAAIALVTDGTGTILYRTVVTAITANASITMSRKAGTGGATTLTYRQLTTGTALLKGWTVSG